MELDERRKREDQDVATLDSNQIGEGHLWYLISADWLKEWHAFKAGGMKFCCLPPSYGPLSKR